MDIKVKSVNVITIENAGPGVTALINAIANHDYIVEKAFEDKKPVCYGFTLDGKAILDNANLLKPNYHPYH